VIRLEKEGIILVSCGLFENKLVNRVASDVSMVFHVPVYLKECMLDVNQFYNPGRRQYDANAVLKMISEIAPREALKAIGMLRVDLYIPILTYIFGQASLNGKVGVVSLYRLRNEHYGLPSDYDLLIERFSKVIIHELGHTYGLIHCSNPVCVMRSSTYVEDIDQKEKEFCYRCRAELNRIELLAL
jgi:archaemetzincin